MFLYSLLFIVLININLSQQVDVLGCGGFVKSDVPISYSRVEIKLYTKQGSLKYQTDCAPNNGYYLIPLYDKGDYLLQVEPPKGWSFEPTSIPLHIDGSTDPCSQGKDINFLFKGFSLTGKVVNLGFHTGPEGVALTLTRKEGGKVVNTLTTAVDGHFAFSDILPGDYLLEAKHPLWTMDRAQIAVTMGQDNLDVGEALVVGGFDVRGEVVSEGEPIQGVHFLLFTSGPGSSKPKVPGCDPAMPQGFKEEAYEGLRYVCQVVSTKEGKFVFPSVPPGRGYALIPFYKGEHTAFEVSPSRQDLVLMKGSLVFDKPFQVQGFSVSGRVLQTAGGGEGIVGAEIYLDSKQQALTRDQGWYHLENMRAGTYRLEVRVPHLGFTPSSIRITPNAPHLPDMVVQTLDLCGRLALSEPFPLAARQVSIHASGQSPVLLSVSTEGSFCQLFAPGSYVVRPLVSEEEARKGLRFVPESKTVSLATKPVLDLAFEQFFSSIGGKVKCLKGCSDLTVRLHSLLDDKVQVMALEEGVSEFSFQKVLPGKYEVSLVNRHLCWERTSVAVEIVDRPSTDLVFTQTGFKVDLTLSHATQMKVKFGDQEELRQYSAGPNQFCVPKPGDYILTPVGCHRYPKPSYVLDTSAAMGLTLTATQHRLSGLVESDTNVTDLKLVVARLGGDAPDREMLSLPKVSSRAGDSFVYAFDFWAKPQTLIEILPASGSLLFQPQSFQFQTLDGCMADAVRFKARAGLFIRGLITPPIEGVHIEVHEALSGYLASQPNVASDCEGRYVVGPLDGDAHYEVQASKQGYVFSPVSGRTGHFNAFKLAEVRVEVVGERGQPLPGVLLSLSGGADYRKNSVTHADGKLSFTGLSPGQYYLRPVLKEYQFEPSSKMMEVSEGGLVPVTVKGRRTAFSCYGTTASLAGDPEVAVAVEALGTGNCSHLQEEAISEQDGSFRIRGLLPYCEYTVHLKAGAEPNRNIERSVPKKLPVKVTTTDLTDQKLVIMKKISQMDVTGNILTSPEHLSSLKVKLYKGEDNLVHVVTMSTSPYFQLPTLPLDNASYTLVLESSAGGHSISRHLRADTSPRHFLLHYSPSPRLHDQELTQGSFLVLPLAILLALLAYHRTRLQPILSNISEIIRGLAPSASEPASTNDPQKSNKRKSKKAP